MHKYQYRKYCIGDWKVIRRPPNIRSHITARQYHDRHSQCSCETRASKLVWPQDKFVNSIDITSPLTKIAPFSKHVLIETPTQGAHQWPHNQNQSTKGDNVVTRAILDALGPGGSHEDHLRSRNSPKLLLNQWSSVLEVDSSAEHQGITTIDVFPDGKRYQVFADQVPQLLDVLYDDRKERLSQTLTVSDIQRPRIYICAHLARDSRCGHAGPVLMEACTRFSKNDSQQRPFEISYINHMGGHKFAGNMLFYMPCRPEQIPEGRFDTVWYGRVNLENINHIIEETFAGRTVHENMRYATGLYQRISES